MVFHTTALCSWSLRLLWGAPVHATSAVCAQWNFGVTLPRLYGDESELHFWTVAAHYLHSLSQEKPVGTPGSKETVPRGKVNNPLDICYDILCENAYFQVLYFMY